MAAEEFKPGKRKFVYAVGRRKSASAQVRLYPKGSGVFMVNGKSAADYFQNPILENRAKQVLLDHNAADTFDVTVVTEGGGKKGQADAVLLGISRALIQHDEALRPQVKQSGFLTRDPRVKERKKYGLRKARRAPQWSKR
jgi:small subunit ribosomal protein S9